MDALLIFIALSILQVYPVGLLFTGLIRELIFGLPKFRPAYDTQFQFMKWGMIVFAPYLGFAISDGVLGHDRIFPLVVLYTISMLCIVLQNSITYILYNVYTHILIRCGLIQGLIICLALCLHFIKIMPFAIIPVLGTTLLAPWANLLAFAKEIIYTPASKEAAMDAEPTKELGFTGLASFIFPLALLPVFVATELVFLNISGYPPATIVQAFTDTSLGFMPEDIPIQYNFNF